MMPKGYREEGSGAKGYVQLTDPNADDRTTRTLYLAVWESAYAHTNWQIVKNLKLAQEIATANGKPGTGQVFECKPSWDLTWEESGT